MTINRDTKLNCDNHGSFSKWHFWMVCTGRRPIPTQMWQKRKHISTMRTSYSVSLVCASLKCARIRAPYMRTSNLRLVNAMMFTQRKKKKLTPLAWRMELRMCYQCVQKYGITNVVRVKHFAPIFGVATWFLLNKYMWGFINIILPNYILDMQHVCQQINISSNCFVLPFPYYQLVSVLYIFSMKINIFRWNYQTSKQLSGSNHWGLIATYGGGGYIQNMAKNRTVSAHIIGELRDNRWIDRGTRVIFIDFTVYNANVNLFCVIR